MQTYYKIVRVEKLGGKLFRASMNAYLFGENFDKMYIPEEWVDADPLFLSQGFGLCVFDNFKDDRFGLEFQLDVELWECHAKPMKINYCPFRCSILHRIGDANQLKNYTYNLKWPHGTVLVESVKLTKRII